MDTHVDEIADDIFRISTWLEDVAPPAGFTMNRTGPRARTARSARIRLGSWRVGSSLPARSSPSGPR